MLFDTRGVLSELKCCDIFRHVASPRFISWISFSWVHLSTFTSTPYATLLPCIQYTLLENARAEWDEFNARVEQCHFSHYPNTSTSGMFPVLYHGQASDLADSDVELPEVQRLLAHSGKLGDGCAPLLHEVQVSLHPAPPLWLHAQLKQARDSLPTDGGGVRVGFLESDGEIKREGSACGTQYIIHILLHSFFFLLYPNAVFCYNIPLHPWGSLKFHPKFAHSEVGPPLNDQAKMNTLFIVQTCVYFIHSTLTRFKFTLVDKV